MSDFQNWLNDVADMPTRDADGWYDAETGIRYQPAPSQQLSAKAQDARAVAKFFGGKALKGSKAQKEWAEKIRADKLRDMTQDQAEMAADPNGLLTHSKFWIEQRDTSAADIGEFVQTQKALLKRHRTANANGDAETVATVAAEYNALTTKWGF